MGLAGVAARLSGRPAERAALLQVVSSSLGGRPQAVLVHGEAGVGKTTLVRSVVEELRADGAQVLWGQGLRFGAVEAMYHPLVLALEGWLAEGDEGRRTALVEAVPSASLILPSLGAPPTQASSGLVTVVDALLSRAFAGGPSVLVVDDVHWADSATRDALSYLVAGFAHQQVALVTTHRDDSVQSDEFHRWLANLRRLPGTQEQVVVRLDLAATADQVSLLLGGPAPPRLVEQVYDRSHGNPYFSELLVRRGDLGSAELPADLPDELSEALLDAWPRALLHRARAHPHPGCGRAPDRALRTGLAGGRSRCLRPALRSAKPSTPAWSCWCEKGRGSATRCSPTSSSTRSFPMRRRQCTPPGRVTSSS